MCSWSIVYKAPLGPCCAEGRGGLRNLGNTKEFNKWRFSSDLIFGLTIAVGHVTWSVDNIIYYKLCPWELSAADPGNWQIIRTQLLSGKLEDAQKDLWTDFNISKQCSVLGHIFACIWYFYIKFFVKFLSSLPHYNRYISLVNTFQMGHMHTLVENLLHMLNRWKLVQALRILILCPVPMLIPIPS